MIFIITTSLTLRICFDLTVTAPNLCRGKGKFSPCPLRLLHKKSPLHCCKGLIEEGGDLLSHLVAVPSALTDLTSLFGMVRGEPRRHGHLSFTSPTDPVAGVSPPEGLCRRSRSPGINILTYGTESRSFSSKSYKHLSVLH